jgi:hypothetical protein
MRESNCTLREIMTNKPKAPKQSFNRRFRREMLEAAKGMHRLGIMDDAAYVRMKADLTLTKSTSRLRRLKVLHKTAAALHKVGAWIA